VSSDGPAVTVSPVQRAGSPVNLMAETERGATSLPTISAVSTGELTLLVNAPISTDPTLRCDAEHRDPTGEVAWRQEGVVSIDPFGTFVLILRTHDLEPGRYELALEERVIDGDEIRQVFRLPFVLAGTP
jgi:hypothetical protein